MKMPKYQLFGFIALAAVSVVSFQNCSQANFSQVPAQLASSTPDNSNSTDSASPNDGPSTPDTASPGTLSAVDITLAVNKGVTLNITQASIIAANKGSMLKVDSVGTPSLGTLTSKGSSYDFVSSSVGTASMAYTISDSNNLKATAKIIIKVVESDIATAPFYGCNLDGKLYSLDPATGNVLKTVDLTYNGNKLPCSDMVISKSGVVYAKDGDGSNKIYTIDVSTGKGVLYQGSLVASGNRSVGLTLSVDGLSLITSEETDPGRSSQTNSLIQVSKSGVKTVLIPASDRYTMYGGDVKLLPDNMMYWTITNETSTLCRNSSKGGNQAVLKYDPATGSKKEIACFDKKNIFGLGFASKALYGFSEQGNLVRVDINTGNTTLIKNTGLTFIGAAANPILW
ncbi:hypothetical protein [Bdellovibrio sp. HCB274]|uniref:hypothetical protein n=1 Tax=Bdellovibrio sp. HCB274 TaxID=3394361 RepID=UPI0039B6A70F